MQVNVEAVRRSICIDCRLWSLRHVKGLAPICTWVISVLIWSASLKRLLQQLTFKSLSEHMAKRSPWSRKRLHWRIRRVTKRRVWRQLRFHTKLFLKIIELQNYGFIVDLKLQRLLLFWCLLFPYLVRSYDNLLFLEKHWRPCITVFGALVNLLWSLKVLRKIGRFKITIRIGYRHYFVAFHRWPCRPRDRHRLLYKSVFEWLFRALHQVLIVKHLLWSLKGCRPSIFTTSRMTMRGEKPIAWREWCNFCRRSIWVIPWSASKHANFSLKQGWIGVFYLFLFLQLAFETPQLLSLCKALINLFEPFGILIKVLKHPF